MKRKKQIKMMALLAVLGLTAASCSKENTMTGIGDNMCIY